MALDRLELVYLFKDICWRVDMTSMIIALNPLLFKMGIKDNDKCTFCNDEKETIQHMLYRCKKVRKFWKQVKDWFNSIIDGDIDIQ